MSSTDLERNSLGVLPLAAARAASAEWTVQSKVDVLLAVNSDHEAGDIHNLLAYPAQQHAP